MVAEERCPCGRVLHYLDDNQQATVRKLIQMYGVNVRVRTPLGCWEVPRHYYALHGINAVELPALAVRYGWTQCQ